MSELAEDVREKEPAVLLKRHTMNHYIMVFFIQCCRPPLAGTGRPRLSLGSKISSILNEGEREISRNPLCPWTCQAS